MNDKEMSVLDDLKKEAQEYEIETEILAEIHNKASCDWRAIHLLIGIPNSVLAAMTSVSVLSNFPRHELIVAVLAIAVSILSALLTFLNPQGTASSHEMVFSRYKSLQDRLRLFWAIQIISSRKEQELENILEEILLDFRKVRELGIHTPRGNRKRITKQVLAQRNLKT